MRDKARVLLPALAGLLVLLVALAVGLPSASRPGPAAVPRAASGAFAHPAGRGPAPQLGFRRSGGFSAPAALLADRHVPAVAPLGKLRTADLFVVSRFALPRRTAPAIQRLSGVTAAQSLDAARIRVNGKITATLGVDPSQFRSFAARPTAASNRLWRSVAGGDIAVSYTMGRLDRLPLGGTVSVSGVWRKRLQVGGFGTVGVTGVDAVISKSVARSLGFPAGNAIVISAPHANISKLERRISRLLPRTAAVEPLVSQVNASGASGAAGVTARPVTARSIGGYPTLSNAQLGTMLRAALSRRGKPYVWGGDGPNVFDCSGLVQWSFAQAGVVMPRVAADQALTGPAVPLRQAAPGDLLFYHTDPTDPSYISHVAIYLGHGLMEQAPEPGMDVQVVPVALGAGFAGVVRVDPRIAASVAATAG